ncbi:MAG: hypothetical protein FJ088_03005, partial [Deltaproteobacteria bacterium]|nr:hypothetical protein [Deltaproteobacteria bacterium]
PARAAGSDGIEDQDSPSSGCAEVSPKSIAGKKFSCVSASSQEFEGKSGNCLPGKDFKPCVSSGDCPGGESCQIIPVKGEYQARCLTKIEDSVEVSERCNYDPYNGEIKYCSSNICHPDWGCLATCGEDGDCGAWECKSSQMPLRYENPFVFSLCVPGVCVEDSGCPDSFFCQKFLNNAAPPSEFGWENRCVKKVAGGALKGGKCNEDKTDLIPDVVCENEGWCVKGFCSSLCDSDGDCVVDAGQICAVEETAYDLNGDSILDTVLDSGYCLTIDGTNLECALETDCLYTGETCAWHEYKKEGEFFISTGCSAKDPDKGGYGEMCGGKSGIVCNNGLCLNEDKKNGIEGFCSGLCVSRNDCEKMTIGTSEYDAFCSSVFYSWGGDIDGIDDLYVPLCFPDLFGSSLLGCYGSLECADDGEVCAPHIIAMNPDSPALVEFLCRKNLTPDGKPPVLKYFDPCGSSKGELGSCEGGLCVKDAFGESYCSKLCAEDGDCVGFPSGVSCSSVTRLDRSNNQFDLILKYCVKKY